MTTPRIIAYPMYISIFFSKWSKDMTGFPASYHLQTQFLRLIAVVGVLQNHSNRSKSKPPPFLHRPRRESMTTEQHRNICREQIRTTNFTAFLHLMCSKH
ncbi:hypothetical protein YC2023_119358 [Brassica napus]